VFRIGHSLNIGDKNYIELKREEIYELKSSVTRRCVVGWVAPDVS